MIKRRTTDAAVAATPTTALERCRHSCCLVAVLLSSWSLTNTYGFSVGHAPLHRSLNPDVREGGKVVLLRHGIRRSRGVGLAPIGMGLLAVNRRRSSGAEPGGGGGLSSTDARAALGSRDWKNLSAEEESCLCKEILEHRRVQDLQVDLERTEGRPVTVHEWAVAAGHPSAHQLLAALQKGRTAERNLVVCHQGLVRSVANRYRSLSKSLSYDDLVQEGSIGLLQAVNHFDATKGARFSSYAVFRIKATILRAIANKDRVIRVPVHAQDSAMRILAASHALQTENGGAVPTDAQLAVALSMPEQTVALYRKSVLPQNVYTMDDGTGAAAVENASAAINSIQGRIRGERWPWGAPPRTDVRLVRQDILRVMRKCLSPAEERALRLRFGLGGGDGGGLGEGRMRSGMRGDNTARTFKEIGGVMELSAEGIRKMVFRAIQKLQDSDEANGLLLAYADLA